MPSTKHDGLLDALSCIPVESCDYQTWVNVGMALHDSGFSLSDWQAWSSQDTRRRENGKPYYSQRETEQKWRTFNDSRPDKVTSGTIIHLAEQHGWASGSRTYDWDEYVTIADAPAMDAYSAALIDPTTVGEESFDKDAPGDACAEFLSWIRALFKHDEYIGVVTRTVDGKPANRGHCDMTREEIEQLVESRGLDALGINSEEGGAFACVNPLDGNGREDKNVTSYRYALIESDTITPEKQLALIHEMRLPCAAITWSGGKSVHAIVHIDASSKDEYRERVSKLYEHLSKNNFKTDEQNKNPSRLTRCPGFRRNGKWQRLIEANKSEFSSWDEWQDWVVAEMTKLPEIETYGSVRTMPPLAPILIDGILRRKQKMLVVGPSKAGKSFLMIELAIAVAEGWDWFGHACKKGRVLLINFEIQRASMLHRIEKAYESMEAKHSGGAKHKDDLDVWNLRGHSAPLNKITPALTRQAAAGGYDLVIIDPIYKVLTGDENSASDMSIFCNEFDVIAEKLNCAVTYCHHHAKGEAGRRASMDRASGSGVFVRDPDAFLDMSPIAVGEDRRDVLSYEGDDGYQKTALPYRVSYTLREFETPMPTDVLFKWPLHEVTEELRDCPVVGEGQGSRGAAKASVSARQEKAKDRWNSINELISEAHASCPRGVTFTVSWAIKWLMDNRESECFDASLSKNVLAQATKRRPDGSPNEPLCRWVKSEVANGTAAELEEFAIS